MTVHDLRNDGKAQPHAGFLRGHKRVENFFAQLVGNAGASVGQAQFHSFSIIQSRGANLDSQCAAVRVVVVLHGFVGILHQIEEGLLAQAFVERNQRQSALVVALDAHRFTCKTLGDNLQDAIEKGGQVRGMRLRMQRTSEVQKLGDQGAEPVDFGRNVAGQLAGQFVGGLQFLGQHFSRALDDSQRIAYLMR